VHQAGIYVKQSLFCFLISNVPMIFWKEATIPEITLSHGEWGYAGVDPYAPGISEIGSFSLFLTWQNLNQAVKDLPVFRYG
jgi:hypothetical protein